MSYYLSNIGKCRSRVVSGIFRTLIFSLLTAAFISTSLHAQTIGYVAGSNNTVTVFSTATNTVTATIPLPTTPVSLVASPDGSRLYVGDLVEDENQQPVGTGNLYVIDTSTDALVRIIPVSTGEFLTNLAITPDGKTLYATSFITGNVTVMDVASGNVVTTIPGAAQGAITVSPDGATVYAALSLGDSVSVISTATNQVTATVPFNSSDNPAFTQMDFTPDGSLLYVPLHGPSQVSAIATASNTIVGSPIDVGGSPSGLAITPDGAFAYVANTGGNSVSIIDLSTNAVAATVPTTDFGPIFVVISPDGFFAYVADENGTVDVISTVSKGIVASIPIESLIASVTVVHLPALPDITAANFIQAAINHIAPMPAAHFDAIGHQTALTNQLKQAIVDIQKGRGAQALKKLTDALTRTDGFPLRGVIDTTGTGIDWITDQIDQEIVYSNLENALSLLTQI